MSLTIKATRPCMTSQNATMVRQATPSIFDPARRLHPKGFNDAQRQRDSKSASTESTLAQPSSSSLQPSGRTSGVNNKPSDIQSNPIETNVDGLREI